MNESLIANAAGGPAEASEAEELSRHLHVLSIYADSLVEGGQYAKAAHFYRFMASRTGGFSRWRLGLGYCLLCERRYDEALTELRQLSTTKLDDQSKRAIELMTALAEAKGSEISAEKSRRLREALLLHSDGPEAAPAE